MGIIFEGTYDETIQFSLEGEGNREMINCITLITTTTGRHADDHCLTIDEFAPSCSPQMHVGVFSKGNLLWSAALIAERFAEEVERCQGVGIEAAEQNCTVQSTNTQLHVVKATTKLLVVKVLERVRYVTRRGERAGGVVADTMIADRLYGSSCGVEISSFVRCNDCVLPFFTTLEWNIQILLEGI